METRVERVELNEVVTLDIGSLMEYSGQGKCQEVECYDNTAARYRDKLRTWATRRNWEVKTDSEDYFVIHRI